MYITTRSLVHNQKESEADTTDNSAEPKKDDSTEDDDGEMVSAV